MMGSRERTVWVGGSADGMGCSKAGVTARDAFAHLTYAWMFCQPYQCGMTR